VPDFLSRERIIAGPRFNRWLVPPTALAMHLCIGMAYGFSVFWLPLSKAIGIKSSIACSADMSVLDMLVTTSCDWPVKMLGWTYTLFFVVLGLSAALWGGWLERAGPRKAGVVAAACWSGGFMVSAVGVATHQLWLMWLGSGVIGGIGLGLGYISPVSTLIKWFPDRRGMATGMAIMGFGGGAMIGSPLADRRRLFRVHDEWGNGVPVAARGLATGGLDTAAGVLGQGPGHAAQRGAQRGMAHAPVLAGVGGAVPECHGGHRHPRHGVATAPGGVWRPPHWCARHVHGA
jgi:hypothetical protein